jgi:hypothetical protein
MSSGAIKRNYGNGKNLTHFKTREGIATRVQAEAGRGSALRGKTITALGHLGEYLHEHHAHRDLAKVTAEQMEGFVNYLQEKLAAGELSLSATSTYISALNRTMETFGRPDLRISAQDDGLARGLKYSNTDLAVKAEARQQFQAWLTDKAQHTGDARYAALLHSIDLQVSAGLRLRESIRISPQDKDLANGQVHLGRQDGTKNGRDRETHVLDPEAFTRAAAFQRIHPEYGRSLTPADMSIDQHHAWAQDVLKAYTAETGQEIGFHGNRHSYAQEQYARGMESRTGVRIECPVKVGLHGAEHIAHIAEQAGISVDAARELDEAVRVEVSEDLGHGRADVTRAYLGD